MGMESPNASVENENMSEPVVLCWRRCPNPRDQEGNRLAAFRGTCADREKLGDAG